MDFFSLEPSQYYPVVLSRFRASLEVLAAAAARNVLMADVRDTLFQGDPFALSVLPAPRESAHEPGAALPYVLFTEEGDSVNPSTIRSDPYDQAWVRSASRVCAGLRDAMASALPLALCESHAHVGVLRKRGQAAGKGDKRCRPDVAARETGMQVSTLCDGGQIRDCFNESVVEAVLDATVVCAGTILGGRNASMAYLQLMSDIAHFTAKESCLTSGVDPVHLALWLCPRYPIICSVVYCVVLAEGRMQAMLERRLFNKKLHPYALRQIVVPRCRQGIHNYIVHYLKPRRPDLLHFEALQVPNDESPIYTLGMADPLRIEVTQDGFAVYNQRGIQPPVVHQIDRKEALKDHLNVLALDRVRRL